MQNRRTNELDDTIDTDMKVLTRYGKLKLEMGNYY